MPFVTTEKETAGGYELLDFSLTGGLSAAHSIFSDTKHIPDGYGLVYGAAQSGPSLSPFWWWLASQTVSSEKAFQPSCGPVPPICPDRVVVIQVCNSNSQRDDNFDVYLNDTYIGHLELGTDAQVGSLFIAGPQDVIEPDFACPLGLMQTYRFSSGILRASNVLELRNVGQNFNSNFGTVGIRNYRVTPSGLTDPCIIADLEYSGGDGESFTLNFNYEACCPNDLSCCSILTYDTFKDMEPPAGYEFLLLSEESADEELTPPEVGWQRDPASDGSCYRGVCLFVGPNGIEQFFTYGGPTTNDRDLIQMVSENFSLSQGCYAFRFTFWGWVEILPTGLVNWRQGSDSKWKIEAYQLQPTS